MTETRRGLGLKSGFVLSVLLVAFAMASGLIPFRQVFAQERSVDLAVRQRDALRAENARLEQRIAALETPGEVERLAREQFGLVKPGEIAFLAVPVPGAERDDTPPAPAFADRPPWWERLWHFITGNDLVTDE